MRFIITLIVLILFNNCTKNKYVVRGTILDILPISNEFLIHHDEIPNFMMAMTMPFTLFDTTDINKFNLGDSLSFTLIIEHDKAYAKNLKLLGTGTIPKYDKFWKDEFTPIDVGKIINDVNLLDTDSNQISLSQSDGKFRFISYIFSRCPMPNMCPAIITKNQFLANSLKNNNIEFIIISFDYLYDTPSVLKNIYANILASNSNIKIFSSTNHINEIYSLTGQSNVSFWGIDENDIGHTLRSILIDPERRLMSSFEGINWDPESTLNSIKNILSAYK